jgi:tetratricopeptide (TPR) repeat protein
LPWLESALRFDRAHALTSQNLCMAYYFLGRYSEAVEACDRALARNPGRSIQTISHPFLAASYAEMGRQQDADGERAIVAHLWPFLDARIFVAQFGTQEARDHILDGLKKAGFR